MLDFNAELRCKQNEFISTRCVVEKVITLPDSEFESFASDMMRDRSFIKDSVNCMYSDKDNAHCLMVVCEGSEDAILVDAEGYTYARYSALIPRGKELLHDYISRIADKMLADALVSSEDGSWVIMLDDVKEQFDQTVTSENGFLRLLLDELSERDEVSECIASEDCVEMTVMLARNPDASFIDLASLIGCNLYDVHLEASEVDIGSAAIDSLTPDTLTEQGKRDWSDVLGARVMSISEGLLGFTVVLSGVSADRLESFSGMLAGECPEEDYARWVSADGAQDEQPGQKL